MLQNSDYPVKFISSINELIMEIFYTSQSFSIEKVLSDLKVDSNIVVDLPNIERKEDILNVSCNAARGNDIINIEVVFDGKRITDYKEKIIGKFSLWRVGFGVYN
jgi:hypothetical protein